MASHSSIVVGKSYGQRSLTDYSPWACKESDTTEQVNSNNCNKGECGLGKEMCGLTPFPQRTQKVSAIRIEGNPEKAH